MRKKVFFLFVLMNIVVIQPELISGARSESYTLEGNSEITLNFDVAVYSLINIEIETKGIVKYNFELRDGLNSIIASSFNETGNLKIAHLSSGSFKILIKNLKEEVFDFSLIREIFALELNSDIGGYNYRNKIFCWKFNTLEEGLQTQFPISSIGQNYYYLTFVAQNDIVSASIWITFTNPLTDSNWYENLDPYLFAGNSQKVVEIEKEAKWMYIDLTPNGNYDIVIILRTSSDFSLVGKILVGIVVAVVGVTIFVLYYIDPLKYRKRKVEGKEYEIIKDDYEQPEDLSYTLREILTKTENKR